MTKKTLLRCCNTLITCLLTVFLQMASSRSWHARFSVLTYLQIMVFYNLFTLLSLPAQVLHIRTLVMQLLLDEQLEVTSTLYTAVLEVSPFFD